MLETTSSQLTLNTTHLFSKKTRDRILTSSLILFNERGFGNVTTALIAKHADILEGSLWYHFNTKKDILTEHLKILSLLFSKENKKEGSVDFKSIINGIFNSYEIIWDFRYILRDNFQTLLPSDCDTLNSTKKINLQLDQWAENKIQDSNKIGLLKIKTQEIENLSEIILMIGRHWLDFSRKKHPTLSTDVLRFKGLNHIIMVLNPFFTPSAKSIIDDLLTQRNKFEDL